MASTTAVDASAAGKATARMGEIVETDIPARLDRLPWSRFHNLVIVALGITWILDGLEVTLASSLAGALQKGLGFTDTDIGLASSAYLLGAVTGALGFGWLTDRLGRKKLFFITLALYLTATAATGLSWNLWSFCLFRFLTGAGIGGEYTAINSTIQELIPARVRGWTDLIINGSFWLGAAGGAIASIVLLNSDLLGPDYGWRVAFFIGGAIGLAILLLRSWIPESPRWLLTHGRLAEANEVVDGIEERLRAEGLDLPPVPTDRPKLRLKTRSHTPVSEVLSTMLVTHRRQTLVGLSLMVAQAFFFNAIFFTYALILLKFYKVADGAGAQAGGAAPAAVVEAGSVGWYLLPLCLGSFLGPLLLGRFFDTLGRRPMIAITYSVSAVLLAIVGYLFQQEMLGATGQTVAWMAVFFFASAAASSAYLTVSETFPLEIRALAIAVFYAIGTGIGGVSGPLIFGALVESGSRTNVFYGYLVGCALMVFAAVVGAVWGTAAEGKSLEQVSRPLASAD